MQLVCGGAFSGKRNIVRKWNKKCSWVSAYKGDRLEEWETKWENGTTLVIEGWEKWIAADLKRREDSEEIRKEYKTLLESLLLEEQKRKNNIVLIMLEIGKGIVPLEKDDRRLRDLAGWITQDAAQISNEVNLVWNGLAKRLK